MADYIMIALQWWLAYLCCAAHYTYAEWCRAPWIEGDMRAEMRQDRNDLRRTALWVKKITEVF